MSRLEDLADQIDDFDDSVCLRCKGDGQLPVINTVGEEIEVTCPKCGGEG